MTLPTACHELTHNGWLVRRAGNRYGATDTTGLCRPGCRLTDRATFLAWATAALA